MSENDDKAKTLTVKDRHGNQNLKVDSNLGYYVIKEKRTSGIELPLRSQMLIPTIRRIINRSQES